MKKLLSIVTGWCLLALVAISPVSLVCAVVMVSSVAGCKTSPANQAAASIAKIDGQVEASLRDWARYVVARRAINETLPAGSEQNAATLSLSAARTKVQTSLDAYNAAAFAAKASLNGAAAELYPATGPMIEAGNAFIATVATYSK